MASLEGVDARLARVVYTVSAGAQAGSFEPP